MANCKNRLVLYIPGLESVQQISRFLGRNWEISVMSGVIPIINEVETILAGEGTPISDIILLVHNHNEVLNYFNALVEAGYRGTITYIALSNERFEQNEPPFAFFLGAIKQAEIVDLLRRLKAMSE